MNHWPFIVAAYGLTALTTLTVSGWAWWAMRKAEREQQ